MSSPGELDNWPWCSVCEHPVEAYDVVGEGRTYIEVRARCHGRDDVLRIEWPWYLSVTLEDLQHQMARMPFFKHNVSKRIEV